MLTAGLVSVYVFYHCFAAVWFTAVLPFVHRPLCSCCFDMFASYLCHPASNSRERTVLTFTFLSASRRRQHRDLQPDHARLRVQGALRQRSLPCILPVPRVHQRRAVPSQCVPPYPYPVRLSHTSYPYPVRLAHTSHLLCCFGLRIEVSVLWGNSSGAE